MTKMKRANLKDGILHVETPNGIINIHAGLTDRFGREVVAVEMIPDEYAGEPRVKRIGGRLVRLKTADRKKG